MKSYDEMVDSLFKRREEYIAERNRKLRDAKKTAVLLSCLCLVTMSAIGVWKAGTVNVTQTHEPSYSDTTHSDNVNSEPSDYNTVITSSDDINSEQSINSYDTPIKYSDLLLPQKQNNQNIINQSTSACIATFGENMLSECCAILEGTVTNVYVKNYTYDTYSDKFEKNSVLHNAEISVVYEMTIDKVWYGDGFTETTILIEDLLFDDAFIVKTGGRYVIPIYEFGNTIIYLTDEYADGDISRESIYSTLYSFHPQIEVTEDEYYIVSSDWTTLTAKNAQEIIMDCESNSGSNYFSDKMRLIDSDTFTEQMKLLTEKIS